MRDIIILVINLKVIVVQNSSKKNNENKNVEYRLNLFIEWLIYMAGYALVLLITSNLFRSLYVENFIYGFLAAVIIYVLNKTLKPVLVTASDKLFDQLGISEELRNYNKINEYGVVGGFKVNKGDQLFPRLDATVEVEFIKNLMGENK